ncbi:hypothetical protein [Nitrobacter hamburgensis]|uniref:hypothetical protein n=1 Tax=Nitrobacter hamburgensis TaxID=912 RepID=UPI0009D753B6|nr:hypothetical protein [Nitrobacter hamburgensis]
MRKFIMALAVGAAALIGGAAANAADHPVRAKTPTDVTQSSTDISSQRRHRHHGHRHYRHHRHYGHRYYRPHYRSYGYAPRYYGSPYYGRGYGYGGPSITFGFGGYRGW